MSLADLFPNSENSPRVHLIGVLGSGMKALAEVLVDLGCEVSGSDQSSDTRVQSHLEKLGVRVLDFHDTDHVHPEHNATIHSPAIPETNVERQAAAKLNIPQYSYVEALAKLMQGKRCIAIAGTHGKSTTTAMLGHVLESAGLQPTVVCGAERFDNHRNGFAGKGDIFVFEACEYRGHFLNFSPQILCITNIEADHFDCFPTVQDTLQQYQKLLEQLPSNATLITNDSCELSQRLQINSSTRPIQILVDEPADLQLQKPGKHYVQNAQFAGWTAFELGVADTLVVQALKSFAGLVRRYEECADWFGCRVIDDYAHHPTEIQATLNTAIQYESYGCLLCVFQPHQVSRTEALFDEFVDALALADIVYLLPVFGARETYQDELATTSQRLVKALVEKDVNAHFIPALDQVWRTLETDAKANDLIFTLGAGDIARIHHERI